MVKSLQLLRPDSASYKAETGPNLLVHLESAPRAFFGNLFELFRHGSSLDLYPKPGRFWGDVFVQNNLPWGRLFESMLWHVLVIAAFVSLSKFWTPREHVIQQIIAHSQVTYYKPSTSFPALGNSGPSMPPKPRESERTARPGAMRVPPQHNSRNAAPPQLKAGKSQPGRIPNSNHLLPAMPLSAKFDRGTGSGSEPRRSLPRGSGSAFRYRAGAEYHHIFSRANRRECARITRRCASITGDAEFSAQSRRR
jgi:hypothetical protein